MHSTYFTTHTRKHEPTHLRGKERERRLKGNYSLVKLRIMASDAKGASEKHVLRSGMGGGPHGLGETVK